MPPSPDRKPNSSYPVRRTDLHDAISRRAREIYERSGRLPGRDIQNWIQAEAEIQHEHPRAFRRAAVKVRLDGVEYIGEYNPAAADYVPGEFGADDPVPLRFEGDRMYIKRPNGKELETRIIKRLG